MDNLFKILKLLRKKSGKIAYILSALALAEFIFLYAAAMSDGQLSNDESMRLKDAITRIVDTLP